MNTADTDVARYLKAFTLMELEEIDEIVKQHFEQPELRYGQQRLASYLTEMIFGKEAAQQASEITQILFGSGDKMEIISSMSSDALQALAYETGTVAFEGEEMRILELLVKSGFAPSNGEAKKLIQSGSIFFNEVSVEDIQATIKKADLVNGAGLLRKGKKSYKTILA
jgi:tyrosyl-tRNA synthetase